MTYTLFAFVLFWGIWLLVPMLIDGSSSMAYLIGCWFSRHRSGKRKKPVDLSDPPWVSVIIPVHNGAICVRDCLESIQQQSYPHDRIEVVVVDNLSTDDTRQAFQEQREKNHFDGAIQWVSIPYKGKAWALNAGIYVTNGRYIFNIDCDVVLHRDAILNMVSAFEADPDLAAATGAIQIRPTNGLRESPFKRIFSECEFLEYFAAFQVGRQYQSATNSLFTLAGAFSAFRREVLLTTLQYSNRTVSEDTDLTFDIHQRFPNMRLACVADAIALVEPTANLEALYSQRVRWQRGQIEVVAAHPRQLRKNLFTLKGLAPPRSMVVDHTLAFPRVVWTFFLPSLYLFGYSLPLIVSATLIMYICYMAIEGLFMGTCYLFAQGEDRQRIRTAWWLVTVMPVYRLLLFWFRFGGFLSALTDPPQWKVEAPWKQLRTATVDLTRSLTVHLGSLIPFRQVKKIVGRYKWQA